MNNTEPWNYTTEYLILHEYELDWDKLSCDKMFSLVEIRLFRKRINWSNYLYRYATSMSLEMLEIASKYFTLKHYYILGLNGLCMDEFVLNHLDDFVQSKGLPYYIIKTHPSEEFLLKTLEYWQNDLDVVCAVKNYIHGDNTFPTIRLMFEVE